MRGQPELERRSAREALVEAIRSGLFTRREVMDRLGISASTLGRWLRAGPGREPRRAVRSAAASPGFTEVSLVGATPQGVSAVVVLRGGRRLRVPPGFDSTEVARLVRALESC